MSNSLMLAALFSAVCLILDIPKAVGNRMPTATSRPFRQEPTNSKPPIYSEEFKPHRQQSPPAYSEELKPARPKPPMYSEELKPTIIRTNKQPRHSEESRRQTRTKLRAYSPSKENSTRPVYSEELKPTRTKPTSYSEEFIQSTTPLNYGSRRKPRPMCGTVCNKPVVKKRKTKIVPSQSNRQKLAGAKNETGAAPEKPRYSYQFSPDGNPNGGGFVPIPSPYVPTARTARSRTEELTAKESRQSPNILGNGNFEILSGGVFPEEETNEIPQGRRVGRTGRTYDNFPFRQQRFQQVPFNVQNFQFPAFYPSRQQLPAHPLFFPRGAF